MTNTIRITNICVHWTRIKLSVIYCSYCQIYCYDWYPSNGFRNLGAIS